MTGYAAATGTPALVHRPGPGARLACWVGLLLIAALPASARPRVFVFTDINIDAGDPDDRQSLVHLLWYADELEITGIVPDRWEARGYEACQLVIAAYAKDHAAWQLAERGYPEPGQVSGLVARNRAEAITAFGRAAATATPDSPLYVLVWGNMQLCRDALRAHAALTAHLRLITVGTGLMFEEHRPGLPADWERFEPCRQPNWNGSGRNDVFADPRFHDLWWLEMNWTENGMFTGDEPKVMFDLLQAYGALGRHLREVTENEPWARYFRVGDTPSVLYLLDPRHDPADPSKPTWAGRFIQHFPQSRPRFYGDDFTGVTWDPADPCRTWRNHPEFFRKAKATLERERPAMYQALLQKLNRIYRQNGPTEAVVPMPALK